MHISTPVGTSSVIGGLVFLVLLISAEGGAASEEAQPPVVPVRRLTAAEILHRDRYGPQINAVRSGSTGNPKDDEDAIDRMEFVRMTASANGYTPRDSTHAFDKRTYSSLPRQFECYSCMSLSYQENWEHLQFMYMTPKVFTNRCNDPFIQRNIPTVLCGSFCASLLEPNVEGGVFIGYKYIRGCVDRILRSGFNQSAIRTHRFNQVDQCRSLPRAQLFNSPRGVNVPVFGDVQLCSCYGDKCNGASRADTGLRSDRLLLTLFCCLSLFLPRLLAVNR